MFFEEKEDDRLFDILLALSTTPVYLGYHRHIPGFDECLQKSDIDGCIAALEHFLEKAPDGEVKEELIKRLKEIKENG